ncbi:MAG: hypothetical protein ICV83_26155 [Cytophagales bacterium]|nr:hypothetical protein [Cytophagales bacterium]
MIREWHGLFVQRLTEKKFELAEIAMRQWLAIPGQLEQTYFFTPAEFYEEWGDAETDSPAIAVVCYEQAIHHRYRTGAFATGAGAGAEIMYHIKRIQKKLKQLQIANDE